MQFSDEGSEDPEADQRLEADQRPETGRRERAYRGLLAADFDGTILPPKKDFPEGVISTLRLLEEHRILRVIATGRSLYSFFGVVSEDFPVEYVVFSSGAGVLRMRDGIVLMNRGFTAEETQSIATYLIDRSVDFMIHHPIPENHRFFYHHTGADNADFLRRCEHYSDHAEPLDSGRFRNFAASQFLIVDPRGQETVEMVEGELGARVSVVHATSPLDHQTSWIEIFPPGTDKGSGIAWVADRYGISSGCAAAVGNDYNDFHMLEWAGAPFVVADAPERVRTFLVERLGEVCRTVAPCSEAGIKDAAEIWLPEVEKRCGGDKG